MSNKFNKSDLLKLYRNDRTPQKIILEMQLAFLEVQYKEINAQHVNYIKSSSVSGKSNQKQLDTYAEQEAECRKQIGILKTKLLLLPR